MISFIVGSCRTIAAHIYFRSAIKQKIYFNAVLILLHMKPHLKFTLAVQYIAIFACLNKSKLSIACSREETMFQ